MPLCEYICSDPALAVLRALAGSVRSKGIREVAGLCGLSPRGAQEILKKLVRLSLARRAGEGRLAGYQASLSPEDRELLGNLVDRHQAVVAREAAERYSAQRKTVLDWIQPTLTALEKMNGPD